MKEPLKQVKHSGIAFEYGDYQLIVPALTVGQTEELTDILVAHDAIEIKTYQQITERLKLRVKVIHAALKRNYPDIEEDVVAEFVTGANADSIMAAAIGTDRVSKRTRDLGENQPANVAV